MRILGLLDYAATITWAIDSTPAQGVRWAYQLRETAVRLDREAIEVMAGATGIVLFGLAIVVLQNL